MPSSSTLVSMVRACAFVMLLAVLASPWLASLAHASSKKDEKKDEAAAISQIAMTKAKAGDFKLCAELYQQAYRTDPAFLGYLYSAARCSQKGGDLDGAERAYRALLARAPADHQLVSRARKHIDEVLEARKTPPVVEKPSVEKPPIKKPPAAVKPPAPLPKPATPVVVPKPAPPGSWKTAAGWSSLVASAAALGFGGWLLADGLAARSELAERLDERDGGLVVSMTPQEAHDDEEAYRDRLLWGGVVAGAGLLVGAAGGWMLATVPDSPKITLLPGPTGLRLIVAWR